MEDREAASHAVLGGSRGPCDCHRSTWGTGQDDAGFRSRCAEAADKPVGLAACIVAGE